jgi:hypothetical protein
MSSSGMLRRVALIRTHVSQERTLFLRSMLRLIVTDCFVPSSPILVSLIMVTIRSSEKSFHTTATRRNIPDDSILHSHRRETSNLR